MLPYKERTITPGRIQALHVTASNVIKATGLFSDIDSLKNEWLYPKYEVGSTKDLTIGEADEAIAQLQAMLRDGEKRISLGQERKIEALRQLLGWSKKGLWGFIKRQTGYSKSVRMLTGNEPSTIIVGLQRIYADGNKELYNLINTSASSYLFSERGKERLNNLKKSGS